MRNVFNRQLLGPLFFMLFGLFFFAIGSGLTLRQRSLENSGIQAPGKVVGLQENSDSDGSSYAPVVQFKLGDKNYEFISSYSSSPSAYEIGEQVIVVYPRDEPDKAIIKGEGQFLHIIFMLVGGIAAALGFYLMLSTLRNIVFINPNE
jgi:hypothetical protein